MQTSKSYTVGADGKLSEVIFLDQPARQGMPIPVDHLMAYRFGNDHQLVIDSFNDNLEIIPNDIWNIIRNDQTALSSSEINYYGTRFLRDRASLSAQHVDAVDTLGKARPVNFVLCPTYSCNCACAYCYQQGSKTLNRSVISDENLETVFGYISEQAEAIRTVQPGKTVVVELFGGEAFQQKTRPVIEKIFDFCRRQKIVIFCTTNGAELPAFLDLFATYHGYIARVATTLDGDRECHNKMRQRTNGRGSFDDIVSSVNGLLRLGIKTRVSINIGKTNMAQFEDYLNVALENGWIGNQNIQLAVARIFDRYYTSTSEETIMESELLEHLIGTAGGLPSNIKFAFLKSALPLATRFGWTYNQNEIGRVRFHYCWASSCAERVEYIDPKLDVYRCTCTTGKEAYKIGNLGDGNVFDLSPWAACNSIDCDKCWNCPLGGYCGGGCRISRGVNKERFCLEERRSFDYLVENMVTPRLQEEMEASKQDRPPTITDREMLTAYTDEVAR